MNLNKKQLLPKVASFPVFLPAEFWVYSYYILWARRGDAKVGELGFPKTCSFTAIRIQIYILSVYTAQMSEFLA